MQTKSRLAKIVDQLTLFFCILLISTLIINKFVKSNIHSIIISAFLTILIYTSIFREIKKREGNRNLTRAEEEKLKSVLIALKFGDPKKLEQFWITALSKLYEATNDGEFIQIKSGHITALCYFNFRFSTFDTPEIFSILERTPKHANVYIFSNNFSDDALQVSQNNKYLHLIDGKNTFLLLKRLNIFPELSKTETKKLSKRTRFLQLLTRKNSFRFFRYGLLLLALSFIISYSFIYRLFGGALLLLGVISLFRPARPATESSSEALFSGF